MFRQHLARRLAQQHSIAIDEFYIYPEASPDFNKRDGGFAWPEVERLNALARVSLSGFSGETKVDAFLVIHDDEGGLVGKHKAKHFLTAGTHDIRRAGGPNRWNQRSAPDARVLSAPSRSAAVRARP